MSPPGPLLGTPPGPLADQGSRLFIDFHAPLRGKRPVTHPAAPPAPWLHAAAEAVEPALELGIRVSPEDRHAVGYGNARGLVAPPTTLDAAPRGSPGAL